MEPNNQFDEKFHEAVDKFAEAFLEEEKDRYQSKLEPFESYKDRQKLVIEKNFEKLAHQYANAYTVVASYVLGGSSSNLTFSKEDKESFIKEIKVGEECLRKLLETDTLNSVLEKKSFQEILGYTDKTLEKFYAVGMQCLGKQDYANASDIFAVLTLINPSIHNSWVAWAICQQALGHWEVAIEACRIAESLDSADPLPYLYASECYAEINDHTHALEEVNKALQQVDNNDAQPFVEMKKAAIEWKEQLQKIA